MAKRGLSLDGLLDVANWSVDALKRKERETKSKNFIIIKMQLFANYNERVLRSCYEKEVFTNAKALIKKERLTFRELTRTTSFTFTWFFTFNNT